MATSFTATPTGEMLLNTLHVKHLEQIDTSLSIFLQDSISYWYKRLRLSNPSLPLPVAFGSAVDGGWSTNISDSSGERGVSLELCILQPFVFLKTLSNADFKLRAIDSGEQGLVKLRLLSVDLADSQSLRELAVMDPGDGEFYLSPVPTAELSSYHTQIARKEPFYSHITSQRVFLETIMTSVYEPKLGNSTERFPFEKWQDKPIVETTIVTLPCVECEGWPEIVNKWPRDTTWPDKNVLDEVKRTGFHLVHTMVDSSEFPLSWRISFAKVEQVLMKTWNKQQRSCYLGLRVFCRDTLLAENEMWSYVLKTIMLWDCERYPPKAVVWEQASGTCMDRLLLALRDVIEQGACSHYFIDRVNILSFLAEPARLSLLVKFDAAITSTNLRFTSIVPSRLEKVSSLPAWYATNRQVLQDEEQKCAALECQNMASTGDCDNDGDGKAHDAVSSIFTSRLFESTYDTYVRVSVSTSEKDKERASQSRSKFMHFLVAMYIAALAVMYGMTSFSVHNSLMVFLLFLVAGILLNLGWSYRWCLCFIYSIVSLEAKWSLSWKVIHFVLSFTIAKFISEMIGRFERPLERRGVQKVSKPPCFPLTDNYVTKPGLVAPMLFLYGMNLLLMCASRSHGLNNFWDVFVCALANQGHFMVFSPWIELFYKEYNQLLVRLKPTICATVCTSVFVMCLLHFGEHTKSFWPWLCMTLAVMGLCAFMCCVLPSYLAVTTCVLFAIMIIIPTHFLCVVMGILYILQWMACLSLPQSSPVCRTLDMINVLSIHLFLQTTPLTAILASVNMVFGCCMYIGWLHSLIAHAPQTLQTSVLHHVTSHLMVVIFIGGVAFLTFQSKPVSTQESFISVSAPVAAVMLLHSLEGSLLSTLVKLWQRMQARDGGVANHT